MRRIIMGEQPHISHSGPSLKSRQSNKGWNGRWSAGLYLNGFYLILLKPSRRRSPNREKERKEATRLPPGNYDGEPRSWCSPPLIIIWDKHLGHFDNYPGIRNGCFKVEQTGSGPADLYSFQNHCNSSKCVPKVLGLGGGGHSASATKLVIQQHPQNLIYHPY